MNIGTGLLLIVSGFLVKRYPMLIAGYNTMSDEQRKKVDIDGLSSLVRNYLILMGTLIVGGPYVFRYAGLPGFADSIIPISVIGILPFLLIHAQQYERNTDGKFKKPLIIVLNLLLVGGIVGGTLTYGTYPPTVELNNKTLTISGLYGINSQITSLELKSKLPKIARRSNGFHFIETSKGNFELEEGGITKLFLQSGNGPFIFAVSNDNTPIFINRSTANETERLFHELKSKLN